MTTIVTRTNKTTELNYANGDANISRDILTAVADPTPGLAHNRSVYECTGTFNFTLPLADDMIYDGVNSSLADDYEITVKNVSTGTITVKTSSPDTLDGVAATGDQDIIENQAFKYKVNNAKNGWVSVAKVSYNSISSDAVMADNVLVRGDGTGRKVQKTGISVADTTDDMDTNGGSITATGGFVGDLTGKADTADTVTTNANLTGPITSSGNSTSIASQTGTGTTFVVNTGPTISNTTLSGTLTFSITDHGTATSLAIDWDAGNFMREIVCGAGAFTFSATSNASNGQAIEMRVTGNAAADRAISFPAGWTFVGYKPAQIDQGATAVLSLRSYGTTDSDIVASWAES